MIWTKIKGDDVPFRYVSDTPFEHDVQRRVPATEKAKRVLGFEATTTLERHARRGHPVGRGGGGRRPDLTADMAKELLVRTPLPPATTRTPTRRRGEVERPARALLAFGAVEAVAFVVYLVIGRRHVVLRRRVGVPRRPQR